MRDYAKEYRDYQGTPTQIRHRARRNLARRMMIRKYGRNRVRNMDIDHKDGNPMNNSYKNLRIMSKSKNRAKH
ncbi:MAG: HNH endonuclease [Proteobacteria bacterium]|jgi:HNH endonuclease|nr:HNH endonuclease [Pseudomonadota bacterium]NBP14047.1 HNH endonuclease [bacterium]